MQVAIRCHVSVDAGDDASVVESDANHTSLRFDNAIVTVHGSRAQRRALAQAFLSALAPEVDSAGIGGRS